MIPMNIGLKTLVLYLRAKISAFLYSFRISWARWAKFAVRRLLNFCEFCEKKNPTKGRPYLLDRLAVEKMGTDR